MVSITIDARQLARMQKALANVKNGVPRALASATNRALAKGRTEVKREVRSQYLIKAKDIPITIDRAFAGKLNGAVVVKDTMLPLGKFKVHPRGVQHRRPIFAQVKRGGGGILPQAFFIPATGPFQRVGPERLPIKLLRTIGAPIMASQATVGPKVIQAMGDTLAKRADHEMKRLLAKA